ncbi:ubiquitin-specific protease doa4 [Podila epigama]|nr:ubiquitin-specific protease doa4 [Podila epigama]
MASLNANNGVSTSNTNNVYFSGEKSNSSREQYSQEGYVSGSNGISGVMMSNGASFGHDAYEGTLNRRRTIYDNHWNNFGGGTHGMATSPPVPAKIPISGASITDAMMSGAPLNNGQGNDQAYYTNNNNNNIGINIKNNVGINNNNNTTNTNFNNVNMNGTQYIPNMPQRPELGSGTTMMTQMRPAIPAKPMRPLPQPPGMSDLKSYTQFGSNFSKMGSQLGKTGLTNLGNTCFMNSVIQCLIATPPLSRYFLDGSFKRHINTRNNLGTQGRLAEAFSDLIRSMWSGQSLVVSPTSFRYAIAGFAPQFKGTEQHDSQEFLSFLLDGLHEDLKMEPQPAPEGENEGSEQDEERMEKLPEYEASRIAWERYLRRDNSIVVSLFQGQFKNRLCCSKCGKTSTTYNAFMYLALPIKAKVSGRQPQTLLSCLNAFVEPETMEGENAWNCPQCKKPRKASKHLTISRVPDVLLIQLKRFSSDGPFKNKIKAMVQYPLTDLDLTRYLPKRSMNEPPEPAIYDLYAVSNHSGEVSSGHYTACVRGETPGSWTNFDDTRVSPCDKSVAVSEHGYTLFYVRKK